MTGSAMIEPRLRAAVRELASTPRLLVALDFDGTVSPLVDDPYAARVLAAATEPVARLDALPNTWVAFVSGRPMESLVRVTESDESALLVGSHGVEVRLGGADIDLGLDADECRRLDVLGTALGDLVERTPGAVLEYKPVGFGVHTRLLHPDAVSAVHAEARVAAERIGGFLDRDGKDILEFAVRDATKGDGIELLRTHVGASAVLYAGDDVTDEDGFAVLRDGDLGLKVGEGRTKALHRVEDAYAVAEVLGLLADDRTRAGT